MRLALTALLTVMLVAAPSSAIALEPDLILRKMIVTRDIRPLPTKPFERTDKFVLGQMLFFDPILSGTRDVSCSTCHLLSRGTSDGLPMSIGTGGLGLGEERVLPDGGLVHPRNSLDLWNRDNNTVKALFWDGRVEALEPNAGSFRSPLGEHLPSGLENTLAVQALFPLVRTDEMLGEPGDRSAPNLPEAHANQVNELANATIGLSEPDRTHAVHAAIMERLLGLRTGKLDPWQIEYRRYFQAAYPEIPTPEITIVELANSIAHFEEIAFATRQTRWDSYVSGDKNAISAKEKLGVVIFFGKGKCAVCHSGPLFSDFDYHSIGVPQSYGGEKRVEKDFGRFSVTGDEKDVFKFRTPPLRNVTLTAPYFHDGSARTLAEAIQQHLDPLFHADKYDETGAHIMDVEEIDAVSYVLTSTISLSDEEFEALIAFLKTLEDSPQDLVDRVVPKSVPSDLPVHRL